MRSLLEESGLDRMRGRECQHLTWMKILTLATCGRWVHALKESVQSTESLVLCSPRIHGPLNRHNLINNIHVYMYIVCVEIQ